MKKLMVASFAAFTMSGSAAAYAEELGWRNSSYEHGEEEMGTRNWKDWDVTIGIGGEYGPVSPGVDKTELDALPYVDIEYKDRYFLNFERGLGAYPKSAPLQPAVAFLRSQYCHEVHKQCLISDSFSGLCS